MRWMWLLAGLTACETGFDDPGCLHRDLEDWCNHSEGDEGPVGTGDCETPAGDPDYRCGDYDVMYAGFGYSGETLMFDRATGELVSVEYWKDSGHYCGGLTYTYGERVACEPTCRYREGVLGDDLPLCE